MTHSALTSPFSVPLAAHAVDTYGDRLTDALCRGLNVLVAAIGIVLTAPLMLAIAVLIKVTSPGPVIYSQVRVGWNRRERWRPDDDDSVGMPFTIYKFRTMRVAPPNAAQVWATKDDPRITAIGRVLRRYRLDELPQLFNVLHGDMNVVGPRPEQPAIVATLRTKIRRYAERQRVLPGITGLAQVSMDYDGSIDDVRRKVALDLEYARTRCPLSDLRIMARTARVMLGARGT